MVQALNTVFPEVSRRIRARRIHHFFVFHLSGWHSFAAWGSLLADLANLLKYPGVRQLSFHWPGYRHTASSSFRHLPHYRGSSSLLRWPGSALGAPQPPPGLIDIADRNGIYTYREEVPRFRRRTPFAAWNPRVLSVYVEHGLVFAPGRGVRLTIPPLPGTCAFDWSRRVGAALPSTYTEVCSGTMHAMGSEIPPV
ncbi:hypothetical protein C8R43DRAFT_964799 [Mycena crocata]|nr:hypothetical protein C8R43DRAFT_964799 [Mycena crocata]